MFKKITEDAILPIRATKYSCAFDVCANEDMVIGAGETKMVGLGIALDVEFYPNGEPYMSYDYDVELFAKGIHTLEDFYIELHPRSSMRLKGLIVGVGLIDIDYADEIKMVIHNPIKMSHNQGIPDQYLLRPFEIKKGDRIGQIVIKRHEGWLFPSEHTKDAERNGGFGSTGS